jgi:hypothetical protein
MLRRCRENGFSWPSPYTTATYTYHRNEHETGVSILYRVASAIAHEADKSRFILVMVGCGRVAKIFFTGGLKCPFPAHLNLGF